MIIILSDFVSAAWDKPLRRLSPRHDVIACRIASPFERDPPGKGLLFLKDSETGKQRPVLASSAVFREKWMEWHQKRIASWRENVERAGASFVEVALEDEVDVVLRRFFAHRLELERERRSQALRRWPFRGVQP
jgi:hypothetical protein